MTGPRSNRRLYRQPDTGSELDGYEENREAVGPDTWQYPGENRKPKWTEVS
jgi:hypothetical protein